MKTPAWIKLLAILALLASIVGIIVLIKIPGNVVIIPMTIALSLAFIAFIGARLAKAKCYMVYVVFIVSTSSLTYWYVNKDNVEIVIDEQQEQLLEEESKTIEEEDLDDALDNLDL